MKKVVTFALAFVLLLTVAGCGNPVKDEIPKHAESVSENLVSDIKADDMSEAYEESVGQNEEENTNIWDFTRLGKVRNLSQEELKEALGEGDVTVEFSLGGNSSVSTNIGEFDFDKKSVLLNSGYEMPIMGLGTYSLDYDTCVDSVKTLLQNGGRLIDTAYMYGNEDAVGEGIRQAMEEYGIPREEIFVITKIYPSQFDDPEAAIEMALEKLDIGYIDMMLLHHPGNGDVEAYKTMERYVEEGKIRSLGLSNWYVEELTDFLPQITITPALVQNEIHPYYQEQEVVPFIQEKGIVFSAGTLWEEEDIHQNFSVMRL